MNHWYFIVPLAVISYVVVLAFGYWVGMKYGDLLDRIQRLHEENEARKAEEADQGSAVVETTPQIIESKRRKGQLPTNDDEDSAIVTVKTPRQIQEEKDAKIKADLDEIQGHSSRIQ